MCTCKEASIWHVYTNFTICKVLCIHYVICFSQLLGSWRGRVSFYHSQKTGINCLLKVAQLVTGRTRSAVQVPWLQVQGPSSPQKSSNSILLCLSKRSIRKAGGQQYLSSQTLLFASNLVCNRSVREILLSFTACIRWQTGPRPFPLHKYRGSRLPQNRKAN